MAAFFYLESTIPSRTSLDSFIGSDNISVPPDRMEATACKQIDMDRIVVDPQIHFGKPCVAGTRIPVQNILELLNEEVSFSDIIRDYYSELQPEDIRTCLQYAIAQNC